MFLFLISLIFTIQSHNYHRSKFISSANFMTGGIYGWRYNINYYFGLKEENKRLLQENETLRNRLGILKSDPIPDFSFDSISERRFIEYTKANVYRNDYSKRDNYILVNKGKDDSISADMGVITDKGIVGIVENSSAHYSRVISILNSNSRINAGLKHSNQYGSLIWNGDDPNIVQLETVPRQAILKKGDTIITNGRSTIFPKGIPIGTIHTFRLDTSESYYLIDIKLFNDMTNLGYVYILENNDTTEIQNLQNPSSSEE